MSTEKKTHTIFVLVLDFDFFLLAHTHHSHVHTYTNTCNPHCTALGLIYNYIEYAIFVSTEFISIFVAISFSKKRKYTQTVVVQQEKQNNLIWFILAHHSAEMTHILYIIWLHII